MKIAFINKYQNKVSRGAETFILELSKRLSKKHTIDILDKLDLNKILKNKYDILIPTNGRLQSFIVRFISFFTKSKVVISGQSGPGLDDRINTYSFPDAFVALSNFALTRARKNNPFIKLALIPNGVDTKKFAPGIKKVEGSQKTVLAVGAFTKEKGHHLTIKAVSEIDNIKLIIVGGGGDKKAEIKALAEKLIPERFEILSLPHEKMPEIYKKADLFVFPTVPWESFGIVLLEAMASNLPVVTTDDPIRREIVSDAGLFVDPNDIQKYKEAIIKALSTKWSDKPRRQAEKFDWDLIAQKYEELFNSL